ncbi:Retrovirus-related Pol polyprotein from transposon TNT 1-94 [Vitis vinifera]|uniref:Retrovirus-related Pol polyprotein from transposon TNT 1-94 n=1 Tax=Vitis vinifera TaxID=29760 RepID=A0A438CNQ0_VITVI|nr:Retrovirus-related Pol polyprotein from transposon TNT 1-94 [Vitis vinifera]
MVWDSVATTYFDGTDTSQVYDLKRRVTKMRQAGGSIEKYYNDLQGLWREIDFWRPNPMNYAINIQKYNTILQEDRVYIFLDGLDDRLDKIRSDVLQIQAYAHVRREEIQQAVMLIGIDMIEVVMVSKGVKIGQQQPPSLQLCKNGSTSGGKLNTNAKAKTQSKEGGCTHCGGMKHTCETCFKLHGYPDWWNEYKTQKNCDAASNKGLSRAALITAAPQLSFTSQIESSSDETHLNDQGYSHQGDHWAWVAERKNRLILETACALLLEAHVLSRYWDDAIAKTVYLLNRMPSKVLQFKTPSQVLSEHVSLPTILLLPPRIFGCVVFVHLHKNQRTKLDPCAIWCIFVGIKNFLLFIGIHFISLGEIRDEELNWWTWQGFEDNPVQMSDGNEAVDPTPQYSKPLLLRILLSRSKYARREARREEKQSEENRGKLAAVFFCTFGALPEVHFLHSIYHFKAQEVKNPMLQMVHDLELKRRSYSHSFLYSVVDFLLNLPDICRKLEAENLKVEANFAALRG